MARIEYFYSAHSGYAYIGSGRFMKIARAADRRIAHRPMDLRAVVAVTGPGHYQRQRDIIEHGAVIEQVMILKHHTDLAAQGGYVTVFQAGDGGELLSRNKLDEPIIATPAISDGRLYVRTANHLFCFGADRQSVENAESP